jgi:Flp pilus assembly protein TadG
MRRTTRTVNKLRRLAGCERGTQLVELAIVLPLLLAMFGAVAEFGRFFYTYQSLTKATRVGARFLTNEPARGTSDDEAANLIVYGNKAGSGKPVVSGLTTEHVRVARTGGTTSIPERVTVRIEGYVYDPIFDLGAIIGSPSMSLNIEVSPSTTMRFMLTLPS